jgi:multiple sugar transport system permease protein
MALIPAVGRTSVRMRALILALYLVLALGALTMVYPFVVMLGTSVESQYDINAGSVMPGYLHSTRDLFGKYAEDKYRADMTAINKAYGTDFATLADIRPPAQWDPAQVRDWNGFVAALPMRDKMAGFGGATGAYSPSLLLDRYHDFLTKRFHGNIRALDRAYTEEDTSFLTVFPPFEQPEQHNWAPTRNRKTRDWVQFERTLPVHYFQVIGADPLYRQWLKEVAYASLDSLNKAWGTDYATFDSITLTALPAGNAAQRRDWATFVRTQLPFRDIVVGPGAAAAYRSFLQGRYKSAAAYRKAYGTPEAAWPPALPDPETIAPAGPPLLDWIAFLKSGAPLSALSVDTPETRYRVWAQNEYHLAPSQASVLPLPIRQADWAYVRSHAGTLRWDFIMRNYRLVLQYIVLHGNGVWVTIVYCALAVLSAVIVNPLCAYALSRYNLPYGNAVLLFLLATMAFPAEVAMIPNFLLLKQLGALNTFWALILPGAASGFSIFLMKGFFDSLPKELYEAGTLDGASELRMFTNITLPLSKPIFAVIALGAFTSAYGAFIFAMLYCQDRSMWTLMVWLYEMQADGAPQYIMMAALTLAAIPTLLVFIVAQNTIMKGIILPSYK